MQLYCPMRRLTCIPGLYKEADKRNSHGYGHIFPLNIVSPKQREISEATKFYTGKHEQNIFNWKKLIALRKVIITPIIA